MAEYPFLPISVDAYLRDTRHLTPAQHGAYFLLLMEAWMRPNTALPDDDRILAKLAGMSEAEWAECRGIVLAFWKLDSRTGMWTQKRLSETKIHVRKTSSRQKKNAKSRWDKEKGGSHGNAKPDAKPMPKASQTHASQSQSQKDNLYSSSASVVAPQKADDDFEKFDKALRAIEGLNQHPVAVAPVIAPLWQLAQQGYNLKTEIIPAIRGVLAKSKPGAIRSWGYFREAIVEQRGAVLNGQHPKSVPATAEEPIDWAKCLVFARKHQTWDPRVWGPYPNQPGCLVPPELIVPTDGEGWIDYERWRTA